MDLQTRSVAETRGLAELVPGTGYPGSAGAASGSPTAEGGSSCGDRIRRQQNGQGQPALRHHREIGLTRARIVGVCRGKPASISESGHVAATGDGWDRLSANLSRAIQVWPAYPPSGVHPPHGGRTGASTGDAPALESEIGSDHLARRRVQAGTEPRHYMGAGSPG
jgi:hypothetical protein